MNHREIEHVSSQTWAIVSLQPRSNIDEKEAELQKTLSTQNRNICSSPPFP